MVFYLKYRPQKIEDLDILSVRETLKAILPKKSFHAFLFTGPKGLGKTSTARLIAKFLNCENRKSQDTEPCNRCYQCKSITSGSNLDLVEIDAASNRGIDEIRELKERINLSTVAASYKVYIIDEVHMLTQEAFNALLKTLEEPPKHVVFVLCTTEPQKVPATIISRCLHIAFKTASEEELVRSFRRIALGEKLNVDKEALKAIAHLSDGSFRDGSKILQELSLKAGSKKITKELVEKEFKVSGIKYHVSSIIGFFEEKNVKSSLELVQKLVSEGVEMKSFIEELVSELHLELLLKVEDRGQSKFTIKELRRLLELLTDASTQLKYAVLPQLPLELAIVEFTADARGPVQTPSSTPVRQASSPSVEVSAPSTSPPLTLNEPPSFLNELIIKVNTENRTIAGLLRGVHLKDANGKKVRFETKFKFHKEKLEEKRARDLIERVASEILKKNVTIEVSLSS